MQLGFDCLVASFQHRGIGRLHRLIEIAVIVTGPALEPRVEGPVLVIHQSDAQLDLIERVELNRNYGKSDTLQLIRILKNYDLLVDPQMDLLPAKRPRGND